MRERVQLKKDAKSQLKGKRGTAALMMLLTMVIAFIPNICEFFIDSSTVQVILCLVVQIYVALLSIGFLQFYRAVNRNEEVSVGILFSGTGYYLKGFGIIFLAQLITIIGYILLVIPGIMATFAYSQALYIYINNPEMGVIECLRTSRLAMKGHKWELFVLKFSFIGWAIACVFTLGILSLYVVPYIGITLYNYYSDVIEDYRGKTIAE